jgi:hypothetical protein
LDEILKALDYHPLTKEQCKHYQKTNNSLGGNICKLYYRELLALVSRELFKTEENSLTEI